MSSRPRRLYEFGPFVLNPAERTLLRDGRPVPLRPKVFDTLLLLVENGGHLVEKDAFMRAVWPEVKFVEEGNLNKTVSMLRQALAGGRGGAKYIETVPKRGYRFLADVRALNGDEDAESVIETQTRASVVFDDETDEKTSTDDETSAASGGMARAADALVVKPAAEAGAASARTARASQRRLIRRAAIAAACLIVLLAVVVYRFYPEGGGEAIDSVAVLPFVNESNNPDVEYLSDGVSESLINRLSQLPGLKVIARSSAFKYRGKEIDPQEAARALGVQAIVSGRIVQLGDTLQVSVELIKARDRSQLWGEQYNRKASDLPAVQADISREIADKLRLRLTTGEQQQLGRRETASPQAYEYLLKARYLGKKGATEDRKKAVEYCQRAIDADPAYAPAYAELSAAYRRLINNLLLEPKEYLPKADEAARKALELDDGLAEAHFAMADVKQDAWDWAAAEREYKRAIELNPNLARAHVGYVYYLIIHGRDEEAIAEARRARELDPLSYTANQAVVHGLVLTGQTGQAIEVIRKMLELDSGNPDVHSLLGGVYQRAERYPEAIASFQEAIRLGDISPDIQIALATVYAEAGDHERARTILKRLETGKEYISFLSFAIVHAALGERERAFALLERACDAHDQQLIWIGVERRFLFAPLQSDPRFDNIMRCVGLAQ
jgi:TolB-like protein/DNA-binding winged helix-turn-helix (wHTH) protein/Tfp pilus assembly protein PilF